MTQPTAASPATIFSIPGPDSLLDSDEFLRKQSAEIGRLAGSVRDAVPELEDQRWISVPLVNHSGRTDDHSIDGDGGVPTESLAGLTYVKACLEQLSGLGMKPAHVRLLTLEPGGIFWPHVDAHSYLRLLLPIESDDGTSLYLFEDRLYSCRVGHYYYLQPDLCHAAFNVSDARRSVACFDVLTSRKCVESILRLASIPEPMTERMPLGRRSEDMLARMFSKVAHEDPDEAGILAFLLGHGLFQSSTASLYRRMSEGLQEELARSPGDEARARLESALGLLQSHPYFPR